MEKSQYALAMHKDTDDFHAHVIANRIGADGKANDLWHERIKLARVCAEINRTRLGDRRRPTQPRHRATRQTSVRTAD